FWFPTALPAARECGRAATCRVPRPGLRHHRSSRDHAPASGCGLDRERALMENEPDILPAESDAGAFTPPPETPLPEGSPMPDMRRPAPHPDPYPFWGYADLVVFFGLAFPCLLLGAFTVKFFLWVFHIRVHSLALELVPAQFLGYGFLFSALYLLLKVHYQRPFWQS